MRDEFIVTGTVSEAVEAELPEMSTAPYPTGGTTLFGTIKDEADAMSLLDRINALGLAVVEMRQLPDQLPRSGRPPCEDASERATGTTLPGTSTLNRCTSPACSRNKSAYSRPTGI